MSEKFSFNFVSLKNSNIIFILSDEDLRTVLTFYKYKVGTVPPLRKYNVGTLKNSKFEYISPFLLMVAK